MVAFPDAVQATTAIAYVHDSWFRFAFVPAFYLNHRSKQRAAVVIRPPSHQKEGDVNERRILKRCDPAFPDSTISRFLWT